MKRKRLHCYFFSSEELSDDPFLLLSYQPDDAVSEVRLTVADLYKVPQNHLFLYKPKVPTSGHPKETVFQRVEELFLNSDVDEIVATQLQSRHWNAEILPQEKECIDIVVIPKQRLEDLAPIRSLPPQFRSRRHALQERNKVLQASVLSPSDAGAHPQLHFCDSRLMAGRPIQRYSVPTALYSPELAKITERFEKIGEVEATETMVRYAVDLVSVGAESYNDEKAREKALTELLNTIFGHAVWQRLVNAGKAKPEAVWGLSMALEIKNEKGVGGNALLQTLIDRLHIIQDSKTEGKYLNSNFPCIVIAISSTLFEVSLTVMTEVLLVDDVFRVDIRGGRKLEKDTITLARALRIITDGLEELTNYYNRTSAHDTDQRADYLFPNPICHNTLEPPSYGPLTFLDKVSARDVFATTNGALDQSTANRFDLSMTLFRAKMPDDSTVMVKFPQTYNVEAHHLLEVEGLAPKLFYHEKMAGGWYMIVMEYLDKARNAFSYLYDEQIPHVGLPRSVYDDVQKAIEILHQKKIVFGDIRLQNVMVQEEEGGRVGGRLVDFDKCGLEGEARYPAFLSRITTYRDAGMEPYGKMLMVHDKRLLAKLKEFCKAE